MTSDGESAERVLRWKPWSFLALTILLGLIGLGLKNNASPNDPGSSRVASRPQIVRVFTSDPDAQVVISAEVANGDHVPWTNRLSLEVNKATTGSEILVTSSTKPNDDEAKYQLVDDPFGGRLRVWAAIFSVKAIKSEQRNPGNGDLPGANVGDFGMGPVFYDQGGVLDAHLPLLANEFRNVVPANLAEAWVFKKEHAKLLDTSPGSNGRLSTVQYFVPVLRTTEQLDNVSAALSNSRINLNVPSGGALTGDNFQWSGGEDLEPRLSAIDFGILDQRSNDEFLSGIAFALAAAAFIAFLQEQNSELSLPGRLRRPKLGQRVDNSNSGGNVNTPLQVRAERSEHNHSEPGNRADSD